MCLLLFFFATGVCLLACGTIILLLGYLVPRKDVLLGTTKEIGIVDVIANRFNRTLEWFKVLGLAIFCVGGFLLSTALLLPSLVGASCFENESTDESAPFKVRIGHTGDEDDEDDKSGIPATEQVKSVQPRREDEAVITGGCLTKLK